jgi:hypothetical protein
MLRHAATLALLGSLACGLATTGMAAEPATPPAPRAQPRAQPPKGPSAPTPRLADGHVDLGGKGIWELPYITDMGRQVLGVAVPSKVSDIPFLPWSKAMYDYVQLNHNAYDPEGFCLPPGGPRAFGTPYPAQFIQQKDRIIIIFEGGAHVWREIHMDGRPHPKGASLNPTYFGHSVGHWEGDTLVIDTVGYNERTWLGFNGFFHTDELHTIERISRPNRDTLRYEATIDDPGAYSRTWSMGWNIPWREGQELQEYICQEENQYMFDLKDDFGQPFFKATEDGQDKGK